jgi:hypothetical protein
MEERYDAYLTVKAIDKNGNVALEGTIKLRCELIPFLEDVQEMWKKHHCGSKEKWFVFSTL